MEAGSVSFADKDWKRKLNLGGQLPLIPSCAIGIITFQLIHIVNLIAHWLFFINSRHCVVLVTLTCSKSPWLGQRGGKKSVDQRVECWWTGCWFFQVDRLLFSSVSLCFGDASLQGSGYQLMTDLRVWCLYGSKESPVGGAVDLHIANEKVLLLLLVRNDLPASCNSMSLFPHKYGILLCQLPVSLVTLPCHLTFILPFEFQFPLKGIVRLKMNILS